jgi:hypothetical protein
MNKFSRMNLENLLICIFLSLGVLVYFTVTKHDFAPRGPRGKVDEGGEFWGDHILRN